MTDPNPLTPEKKAEIYAMSRKSLCYKWRFAKIGDNFWQGEAGAYAAERLKELGGFSPEISKQIAWGD